MARAIDPYDEPQRLRRLSRWLVGLLIVSMVVQVAVIAADADQLDVFNRLVAGEDVSYEEAKASDDRLGTILGVAFLCLIATVVVWVVWFRRAYRNVPRLSRFEHRFRPGWATGSWFVPILNLFRPKQIANDIWRACDPSPRPSMFMEDRPVSPLLHVWWAAWLIANVLANVDGRRFLEAETIADQRDETVIALVADSTWLALTAVAVVVVVKMTSRYERRREQELAARAAALRARLTPALNG